MGQGSENFGAIGAGRTCEIQRFPQDAVGIREIACSRQGGTKLTAKDEDGAHRVVDFTPGDLAPCDFEALAKGEHLCFRVSNRGCAICDLLKKQERLKRLLARGGMLGASLNGPALSVFDAKRSVMKLSSCFCWDR